MVIKRSKNNRQAGPDKCRTEQFKCLDAENKATLLMIINEMFLSETFHPYLNKANIVQIYKKGDAIKMENYRPIALLQTIYKFIAAMVKNTVAAGLETWISKTQYGFRPKRSTAQAIFIARRLMDIAERTGSNLTLILLDWEKAFDKIAQDKLLQVLRRLNVPKHIYSLIANIYKEPEFCVRTQ